MTEKIEDESNSTREILSRKYNTRYYLDAKGFGPYPGPEYEKDRKNYTIAFFDDRKASIEERVQAFSELALRHLEEGKEIEARADSYFKKWNGFAPSEPQQYVSQREVDISNASAALTGHVMYEAPRVRNQSIENCRRDIVATYSYALARYNDVVGCYLAIEPKLRPDNMKSILDEVLEATHRIKVPEDIANVCEPWTPAPTKLAKWIQERAQILLFKHSIDDRF